VKNINQVAILWKVSSVQRIVEEITYNILNQMVDKRLIWIKDTNKDIVGKSQVILSSSAATHHQAGDAVSSAPLAPSVIEEVVAAGGFASEVVEAQGADPPSTINVNNTSTNGLLQGTATPSTIDLTKTSSDSLINSLEAPPSSTIHLTKASSDGLDQLPSTTNLSSTSSDNCLAAPPSLFTIDLSNTSTSDGQDQETDPNSTVLDLSKASSVEQGRDSSSSTTIIDLFKVSSDDGLQQGTVAPPSTIIDLSKAGSDDGLDHQETAPLLSSSAIDEDEVDNEDVDVAADANIPSEVLKREAQTYTFLAALYGGNVNTVPESRDLVYGQQVFDGKDL
jgi:hypothetical protein